MGVAYCYTSLARFGEALEMVQQAELAASIDDTRGGVSSLLYIYYICILFFFGSEKKCKRALHCQ
jgi:hypothetical protein